MFTSERKKETTETRCAIGSIVILRLNINVFKQWLRKAKLKKIGKTHRWEKT